MAAADEDYAWPAFDERTAAVALLHLGHHRPAEGRAVQPPLDACCTPTRVEHARRDRRSRAVDRVLPVVPMFHVNAWGMPYAAPMAGAALVHAGPAPRRRVACAS